MVQTYLKFLTPAFSLVEHFLNNYMSGAFEKVRSLSLKVKRVLKAC